MKALAIVLLVFFLGGCAYHSTSDLADPIIFEPPASENAAREVLQLGDSNAVSESEFRSTMLQRGMMIEDVSGPADLMCQDLTPESAASSYFIDPRHGEQSSLGDHWKAYCVSFNQDSMVQSIQELDISIEEGTEHH